MQTLFVDIYPAIQKTGHILAYTIYPDLWVLVISLSNIWKVLMELMVNRLDDGYNPSCQSSLWMHGPLEWHLTKDP